jgi:hypothetical protein
MIDLERAGGPGSVKKSIFGDLWRNRCRARQARYQRPREHVT